MVNKGRSMGVGILQQNKLSKECRITQLRAESVVSVYYVLLISVVMKMSDILRGWLFFCF